MSTKIQIVIGDQQLTATLYDNSTADAFIDMLPMTLPMLDRYDRELVHRFETPLPANETVTSGYEVGDIAYWTPRHSFVIFYAQNGEVISNLQPVGHIDAGVDRIDAAGDTDVAFHIIEE
ncbi:cyclophilin-like fold protein [Saccharomonospora sp. NPDC046836]|uniref:cyclophilin-like fold protein n=1 Tax=Saccharomonospora sp. NPDC046836 TaxID=3156921 RepID=UPI0033CBF91A